MDLPLKALDGEPGTGSRPRFRNRIFDALRAAIIQLQLRPGDLLSEADVARQLGVSRQPVREAFIKLAEAGLVEAKPQRGTFVKLISAREVENARFIREAIEVAVSRKAAAVVSPASIAELRRIVEAQREAGGKGAHAEFLRQDEALHQAIAQSADCDYAWRLLESLKAQFDRVRYLSLPDATPIAVLIKQHEAIVDALAQHDADAAEAAMRAHLSEILVSLPQLAKRHPELFTE